MNLSVVIPTLGGYQLKKTINALHSSSVQPNEILICIPKSSKLLVDIDSSKSIKIIRTKRKGQVYQRAIGFKEAKGGYILQLDDDIYLQKDTIKNLLNCINISNINIAVAPTYHWVNTNTSVFERETSSTARGRLSYWIMNGKDGYQPGTVSEVGIGFGLNFVDKNQDMIESQWLPGGCILHRSDNLVKKDYFPFSGKAYSEDLIHSHLLQQSGVKLFVSKKAIAYVRPIFYPDSLVELYKQFKATNYLACLRGRGYLRLRIYYFFRFFQISFNLMRKILFNLFKEKNKLT